MIRSTGLRTLLSVMVSLSAASSVLGWGFPYGQQKVRGVNLGGWLVLEVSVCPFPKPSHSIHPYLPAVDHSLSLWQHGWWPCRWWMDIRPIRWQLNGPKCSERPLGYLDYWEWLWTNCCCRVSVKLSEIRALTHIWEVWTTSDCRLGIGHLKPVTANPITVVNYRIWRRRLSGLPSITLKSLLTYTVSRHLGSE